MKTSQPGGSIKPPSQLTRRLAIVIALAFGAAARIGGYTFTYAKGASYLSNDPF